MDIVEGLPQGKGLDLQEAAPIERFDSKIVGTNDYEETAESDVVIITSGLAQAGDEPRRSARQECRDRRQRHARGGQAAAPSAVMIVVSNPLDAMVYTAWKVSGFPHERVVGQAGVLDAARYRTFIAMELGCSVEDITALLLGGHGDDMVPLPSYTSRRRASR